MGKGECSTTKVTRGCDRNTCPCLASVLDWNEAHLSASDCCLLAASSACICVRAPC